MKDTNDPVERMVDPCPKKCLNGCNYCVLQKKSVPVEKWKALALEKGFSNEDIDDIESIVSIALQAAVEERDTFWKKNEEKRVVKYEALGYHKGKIEERKRIAEEVSNELEDMKYESSKSQFEEGYNNGVHESIDKTLSIINKHQ